MEERGVECRHILEEALGTFITGMIGTMDRFSYWPEYRGGDIFRDRECTMIGLMGGNLIQALSK